MRVLVLTVVHHPLDARIHHRQITALLDAGHEVVYAAPFTGYGVPLDEVDPRVVPVDVPRATRWARLPALRRARSCLRSQADVVDVAIVHDPELLVAGAGLTRHLPTVWDVHEDLAASFDDKTWVPPALARLLRGVVRRLERWAEDTVTLMLAEEARPFPPRACRGAQSAPPTTAASWTRGRQGGLRGPGLSSAWRHRAC